MDRDLLASAKSGKVRRGKKELIKHLSGGKLTWGQAMKAKCYDCDGMGDTGECDLVDCPLYRYSPYRIDVPLATQGGDKQKQVS